MELQRKRMHDLIEQAAKKRSEKSKWDPVPPRRPSQEAVKAAQPKPTLEEDYNLFDR
jgi:hypothetical protein